MHKINVFVVDLIKYNDPQLGFGTNVGLIIHELDGTYIALVSTPASKI